MQVSAGGLVGNRLRMAGRVGDGPTSADVVCGRHPTQYAFVAAINQDLVECSAPLPVHNKIIRRIVLVITLLATMVLVRLWPEKSTEDATSVTHTGEGRQHARSTSTVGATPEVPAAPNASGTAVSDTPAGPQGAPLQIDVRTPATVQSGESFQITVDLETTRGIQQLAFSVTYNHHVLQLVGSSEGTFVQQWGLPTEFGAEEPSDGNILIHLNVNNGLTMAGTGSVAILQFRALRAGTSPVTVDSMTFVENGSPRSSTTPSVHQGLVKVE